MLMAIYWAGSTRFFFQPVPGGYRLGQRVRIMWVCLSAFPPLSPLPPPVLSVYLLILLLISSSLCSLEEGSSQTCVGAVPRDLSLYDIMSGIRRRRRRRRWMRKRRRGGGEGEGVTVEESSNPRQNIIEWEVPRDCSYTGPRWSLL